MCQPPRSGGWHRDARGAGTIAAQYIKERRQASAADAKQQKIPTHNCVTTFAGSWIFSSLVNSVLSASLVRENILNLVRNIIRWSRLSTRPLVNFIVIMKSSSKSPSFVVTSLTVILLSCLFWIVNVEAQVTVTTTETRTNTQTVYLSSNVKINLFFPSFNCWPLKLK